MRVILLAFIFFSFKVSALEVPFDEFFHFIQSDQNRLLAPKFNETECHQVIPGQKQGFDGALCIQEICGGGLTVPGMADDNVGGVIRCALNGDASLKEELCQGNNFVEHYPRIKDIAEKMKDFYLSELQLTGFRIKAAVSFMKTHENPNSPLDNLQLNVMDLVAYLLEDPSLYEVKQEEGGLEFHLKSHRRLKRKLKWRFHMREKSEQQAAVNVLKAIFEDTNSLMALHFLGPDYVLANLMQENKVTGDPDEILRNMKYNAIGRLQKVLGNETIDPEYRIGKDSKTTVGRDELLNEVLTLESLSRKVSSADLKRLSKANFPKKRFYNRTKWDRDWSDPEANQFHTTLQHLEELSKIYVGDEETVRDSDVYSYLTIMLKGLALLPSQKALDQIKEKVPGFIEIFFDSFKKEFSNESTGIIKSEIGKLHINYPESKEEYLKKVEDWLIYQKAIADDSLKQLRQPDDKKATAFFGRQYLQSLLMNQGAEGKLGGLITLVAVNPIPDFYIGTYNGIKMGAYAVNEFDRAGKQVLAHELGHHVGHFMEENPLSLETTGKFKVVRQCLSENHKDAGKEVTRKVKSLKDKRYKWKENKYTEEDFADWIGAKTSDHNMACLFVQNINPNAPVEELLANSNPKDPHSSGFFRLLNVELQQKGKVPESCQNEFVKSCPKVQPK